MKTDTRDDRATAPRLGVSRLIDHHNPGVTLLVVLWAAAFALRRRLIVAERLQEMGDNALKSLLFVIPIMLVGWGVLAVVDRRYRLGLFR